MTTKTNIRIASFNTARNYSPHGLLNIITHLKLDYLAIQEPPTTPLTPERNNQHDKPFQLNFKIISTPYNKIIIGPNLSHTIIDHHSFAQGRGQYVTLKTQNQTLTIYSIYDDQHQHKESLINAYKTTTTAVKQRLLTRHSQARRTKSRSK